MRNELFTTSASDAANLAAPRRTAQARRSIEPFVTLAAAQNRRQLRVTRPLVSRGPLSHGDRASLAALRVAEFAAWQASGGDALRRPGQTELNTQ